MNYGQLIDKLDMRTVLKMNYFAIQWNISHIAISRLATIVNICEFTFRISI
jgi:hypothetical protein